MTTCTNEIYDAFLNTSSQNLKSQTSNHKSNKTFFHGHSYTANPVACSAALASLDLLEKDSCKAAIERISRKHKKFVEKYSGDKKFVDVRCLGTILAVEYKSEEKEGYFSPLRDKLYDYFIGKGILLRPLGNVVYVMPPYCITDEDLEEVYEGILSFEPSLL